MSANRMTRHFGHEATLDEMLKKHAAGRRGRPADTVRRVRAAVTCLLHDEGGWWSPSCVRSRAALPRSMNMLHGNVSRLASLLVRAALAELTRDGRVDVGYAGPGFEPLFRWVR